jgi:hypothetical protein
MRVGLTAKTVLATGAVRDLRHALPLALRRSPLTTGQIVSVNGGSSMP